MNIEDFEPLKQPKPKKNLDEMSIEALHVYIIELEEEIEGDEIPDDIDI